MVLLMITNYTTGFSGYRNISYWRMVGPSNTDITNTPRLYDSQPWWILDHYKTDLNYFPVGRYNNDISYIVNLNRTLFPWITEETWIHTGFSYKYNPYSPVELEIPDEVTVLQVKQLDIKDNLYFAPNARLEQMSLELFIIELIILVVMFVCCCIFYIFKWQPMYSRGITPGLACIGHFVHVLSGITQWVYTLEDFQYNCIWLFFFQQPVLLTLLFLSLFHYFRFVLIVNLNKLKMDARVDMDGANPKWNPTPVRILKILGSNWFLFIVVVVIYLAYILAFFIGYASTNFVCNNEIFWNSVFYAISIGVFCVGFIILFIYDMILNLKKFIKCKLYDFWKEDRFYYRFEIYFLGVFLAFPFWVISMFMNPDFFQIKTFRFERNQIRPEIPIVSTLGSMSYYTFFFMQCGFVFIVTIFRTIYRLFFKKRPPSELMLWVEKPRLRAEFVKFLASEWSTENMSCYEDIMKYQAIQDKQQRLDHSKEMYINYLNGFSARMEVNVPLKVSKDIKVRIDNEDASVDLFVSLQKEVIGNLSDSFARFTVTLQFLTIKTQDDLIKNT